MNKRHRVYLYLALLGLAAFMIVIFFNDKGLMDLSRLKGEKQRQVAKSNDLARQNLSLLRAIERLKSDPRYVENVARRELGVIGRDELILKLNSPQGGAAGKGDAPE